MTAGKKNMVLRLVCVVFLAVVLFFYIDYLRKSQSLSKVIVDKQSLKMHLINYYGDTIFDFPVAVGTNYGNKEKIGDLKTPEGVFPIQSIEDATTWQYDFENDGKGPIDGAYGPWFIRLKVKDAKGIGIHGTHENSSIGKRVSHGCVRMKNEDLQVLVSLITPGIEVLINTDTMPAK